jgi:hypothetical protein
MLLQEKLNILKCARKIKHTKIWQRGRRWLAAWLARGPPWLAARLARAAAVRGTRAGGRRWVLELWWEAGIGRETRGPGLGI